MWKKSPFFIHYVASWLNKATTLQNAFGEGDDHGEGKEGEREPNKKSRTSARIHARRSVKRRAKRTTLSDPNA
ncbi:hypothetical protein GCM10007086_17200 [Photobacterium aphoticum]|nr:hypothetical protein GCM10007086_17200 [Photobacterium aphoticum]